MTVHTPGDPDKAVRIATAAALAESARKLAQEAASFIDNEEEVCMYIYTCSYAYHTHIHVYTSGGYYIITMYYIKICVVNCVIVTVCRVLDTEEAPSV